MSKNYNLPIQWAPKIKRHLIKKMYDNDALGLVDEELITLIGFSLMQRCESILMVTEAREVYCPSCDILIICTGKRWSHENPIICNQCG